MNDKQLYVDMIGLAGACSYALDCIESEIFLKKIKPKPDYSLKTLCLRAFEPGQNTSFTTNLLLMSEP